MQAEPSPGSRALRDTSEVSGRRQLCAEIDCPPHPFLPNCGLSVSNPRVAARRRSRAAQAQDLARFLRLPSQGNTFSQTHTDSLGLRSSIITSESDIENETARGSLEIPPAGPGGPVTVPVKRRDDLILRRIQRELMLLDMEFNQIHQLNETARFIWDKWEEVPNAVEIAKLLAQKFDVEEHVALNDVSAMVDKLRELNLLVA